jgi:TIR domain
LSIRFESANLNSLYTVLDSVAWLDSPTSSDVAQFADIDPRTAGKLLKNASQIKLIDKVGDGYIQKVAYPYKGSLDQKKAVVKEALVKLPLLVSVRQFLQLGDGVEDSIRKAATVAGITPFDLTNFKPLLKWADALGALVPGLLAEDLVEDAVSEKQKRHEAENGQMVAFLSHSSTDKPIIRQLAADLMANGIGVWLDEHQIQVGDSIPEKISQGLANSDFFLIGLSDSSAKSQWVQKELNSALMTEMNKREVHILPLKLDSTTIPNIIADKKYADFSESYKTGLQQVISSIRVISNGK